MRREILDGPWSTESDRMEWVDATSGYTCVIRRHPTMKYLCGYVGIPEGHPAYEKCLDDNGDLSVHGGVTYTGANKEMTTSVTAKIWWVGFDCAHAGDLIPGLGARGVYRTTEYVQSECVNLARQLLEMKNRAVAAATN